MVHPAEAINFHPVKQAIQPHLRLVAEHGNLIEAPATPEDELAARRLNLAPEIGRLVNERLEAEYDAITQFAELVDGAMRTSFELEFDGDELYGYDGRSMGEITEKALTKAEKTAETNPNLAFEVRRRRLEREEYLLMLEMAKGNGSNTMIVQSDFPEELRDADEDIGGYNVTRQQSMDRVLARLPNGNIRLQTQTLDGSNRQALEAVHAEVGSQAEPGELLGQRIQIDLPAEEQEGVMDRITSVYDREMTAQYGGEWYAGRRPADYRNTYDFVREQTDLIETCVDLMLENNLTDTMMYDLAATMQARFESDGFNDKNEAVQAASIVATTFRQPGLNPEMLRREIRGAGRMARMGRKSFSACGSTLKGEGLDESTEGQLEAAGYGERAGSKSWHGGKKFKNEKCVSCEKVKNEVGACKICEDCVKNPKKRK